MTVKITGYQKLWGNEKENVESKGILRNHWLEVEWNTPSIVLSDNALAETIYVKASALVFVTEIGVKSLRIQS